MLKIIDSIVSNDMGLCCGEHINTKKLFIYRYQS